MIHVHINGETISATPNHPFYVDKLGWTLARSLRAGDILVLSNGEFVVIEWVQHEILESPIKVYNFEVEDFHTYFVGGNGVFVHNGCGTAGNEKADSQAEVEVYYRTMSQSDYEYLQITGELPATKETFISPTYSFSSNYSGVTVRFELNVGTTDSLLEIGLSNNSKQAIKDYGILPQVSSGWNENYVYFKGEGLQTNIGLVQGRGLEIFNSNIVNFSIT